MLWVYLRVHKFGSLRMDLTYPLLCASFNTPHSPLEGCRFHRWAAFDLPCPPYFGAGWLAMCHLAVDSMPFVTHDLLHGEWSSGDLWSACASSSSQSTLVDMVALDRPCALLRPVCLPCRKSSILHWNDCKFKLQTNNICKCLGERCSTHSLGPSVSHGHILAIAIN